MVIRTNSKDVGLMAVCYLPAAYNKMDYRKEFRKTLERMRKSNQMQMGKSEIRKMGFAQDNVNTWLSKCKSGFMLRKTDHHIRAVLSPHYTVYDSERILDAIQKNVNLDDYSIWGSFISEERLHVRLIGNEKMHIDAEELFVDSSDVGRNILSIRFGIYKLICTNGLVIGKAEGTLYKQKHIGVNAEEFESGIIKGLEKVSEMTASAEKWVHKVREESIDINTVYTKLKSIRLNVDGQEKVVKLMIDRYGMTKWGLINGITEVAQNYTLDKREELEIMADNILISM